MSKCAFAYVTTFCNMNCFHCYVGDIIKEPKHMSFQMLLSFLKYITALGYNRIEFLGGEPFLYPEIEKALIKAKELGLETYIGTNATITKSLSVKLDRIAISMDHVPGGNSVRASHFDNRIRKNIEFYKDFTESISFTVCVSNRNIEQIFDILDYAEQSLVDLVYLHYFTPLGNGREHYQDVVDRKRYHNLILELESRANLYSFDLIYQKKYLHRTELNSYLSSGKVKYFGNKARDFTNGLSLFPDSSCHFDPLYFDKEPIAFFKNNKLEFVESSKELNSLFFVPNKCMNCNLSNLCGGYDTVYNAYPKLHKQHATCDDEFIPIETTKAFKAKK